MKMLGTILILALLAGCEPSSITDQCLRKELFSKCMDLSPADPANTMYQNKDELVSYCEEASFSRSSRPRAQVKAECAS